MNTSLHSHITYTGDLGQAFTGSLISVSPWESRSMDCVGQFLLGSLHHLIPLILPPPLLQDSLSCFSRLAMGIRDCSQLVAE